MSCTTCMCISCPAAYHHILLTSLLLPLSFSPSPPSCLPYNHNQCRDILSRTSSLPRRACSVFQLHDYTTCCCHAPTCCNSPVTMPHCCPCACLGCWHACKLAAQSNTAFTGRPLCGTAACSVQQPSHTASCMISSLAAQPQRACGSQVTTDGAVCAASCVTAVDGPQFTDPEDSPKRRICLA